MKRKVSVFSKHLRSLRSQGKAQAAVEFMTTYGWALLIIAVAIGAIAYFGVIDPSDVISEQCDFNNGIVCKGVTATAPNTINLALLNNYGQTIYDVGVVVVNPQGLGVACTIPNSAEVNVDTLMAVTCVAASEPSSSLVSGQKTKMEFKFTFKKIAGGYTQVSTGEAYTTVN